jgi:hypothetical protein
VDGAVAFDEALFLWGESNGIRHGGFLLVNTLYLKLL